MIFFDDEIFVLRKEIIFCWFVKEEVFERVNWREWECVDKFEKFWLCFVRFLNCDEVFLNILRGFKVYSYNVGFGIFIYN